MKASREITSNKRHEIVRRRNSSSRRAHFQMGEARQDHSDAAQHQELGAGTSRPLRLDLKPATSTSASTSTSTSTSTMGRLEAPRLRPSAGHHYASSEKKARATNHRRTRLPTNAILWSGTLVVVWLSLLATVAKSLGPPVGPNESNLQFDAQTGSYQGLTFTFDPRLDKQVDQRLHFEHWLSIMQQSSSLLYEALNRHAHLAEIKVLIPFKWRQLSPELRPVLYRPGAPVITNRRMRFTDSDVIVGFEDPVYKDTPFALQHDECGRPGLNIRMPISFLDEQQPLQQQQQQQLAKTGSNQLYLDSRLKARQFVREFASLRYGVFKESGFRSDFMYPPFSSVAGLGPLDSVSTRWTRTVNGSAPLEQQLEQPNASGGANRSGLLPDDSSDGNPFRGFDENFADCKFDTSPASGLPANAQAAKCVSYLVRADKSLGSYNLMSADPFSYSTAASSPALVGADNAANPNANANVSPAVWDELAEQTKWHFCGENFANANYTPLPTNQLDQTAAANSKLVTYEHNKRAANKQNKMCQERSALEVIRASEDFRGKPQQTSPPNFNRLPTPNFRFLQEMPPRVILCIEYTSHLFQSRRLSHPLLDAAINKFLALDLVAESELATVVFGQHQSRLLKSKNFLKLDSSLDSRFALLDWSDVFKEQVQYYSQQELAQMEVQSAANSAANQQQPVSILKGSCSLAKMMAEVNVLLQKSSTQYDDIGADLIVLTSGLFVEDEAKIDEIIRASNFKLENNRLNMIIYPSTMLFDTKSRENLVVLDSNESEQIIRSRVNKLLLIQKLTGAKIHLIREQLDSNGDVKMSTLVQFYQIFERLARGHSWDQTGSMVMLHSQQVDSRQQQSPLLDQSRPSTSGVTAAGGGQYRISYQFNLDESVRNELIVGFIDLHSSKSSENNDGQLYSLRNLQLRSPGGQLIFTQDNTTWNGGSHQLLAYNQSLGGDELNALAESQELAVFSNRAHHGLAAFHVKPAHLSQLSAARKLAGVWTLSALSDRPIQTSGVAMARVNPEGDTLMGDCWIQTYNQESVFEQQSTTTADDDGLKMVKVFVQTTGGVGVQRQELEARMEVHDEMGNIVQNVQMLDDGLGAPDMTQNDGIHSQYVQRASRPGFYKVSVELTSGGANAGSRSKLPVLTGQSGQDNVCCGSFIPNPSEPSTSKAAPGARVRATRQLYCGTFFVGAKNKLAQQRPPRTSNLTVVNVDQDNRRVTLRWFEPQLDINSNLPLGLSGLIRAENSQLVPIMSEIDLLGEETHSASSQKQPLSQTRAQRSTRLTPTGGALRRRQAQEQDDVEIGGNGLNYDDQRQQQQHQQLASVLGSNVLMASHQQRSVLPLADQIDRSQSLQSRYDIKVFPDRDMLKRTFDAKPEVGFKFNEWSVEGQLPNASQFGGMKEVTVRVPYSREGIYFIAMKVTNNAGVSSQLSNIVQFYLRNNMTLEEAESIYGQPGVTVDAEGNIYDKNGELVQRGGSGNQLSSYSLLKGSTALDGLSVLILISVLVFMMVILCITLVACLMSSARQSLKTNAANKTSRPHKDDANKKSTISSIVGLTSGGGPTSAGSGSSMVSSGGCESSEVGACSGSSSLAGSCTGHQDVHHQQHLGQNGSLFFDDLQQSQPTSYNKIQQQQRNQQQQAQLIHQQLISSKNALKGSQHEFYNQPQQQQQQQQYYAGPNHTIVNGYTYATVMQTPQHPQQQDQYQQHYATGDLNQNGLAQLQQVDSGGIPTSSAVINPVQSWPADLLLSHYDKVKQARERNEAPPVMRIETLEHNSGLQYSDGLPAVLDDQQGDQYATLRNQQQANFYNQQLHQQLSSVLKSKRQNLDYDTAEFSTTSPALEGITNELLCSSDNGQTGGMPPPPHYMYCPIPAGMPLDNNGLSNQLTDPSIYSQSTNLQQVVTSSPPGGAQDQLASYYANQQQWTGQSQHASHVPAYGAATSQQHQSGSLASSGIYSSSNVGQQQSSDAAISEV